eukprot:m.1360696 g.1360696  ORF g.1360696 m.1360696 type:complete len:96 (-) comp24940_c1_seq20:1864-2151(-)
MCHSRSLTDSATSRPPIQVHLQPDVLEPAVSRTTRAPMAPSTARTNVSEFVGCRARHHIERSFGHIGVRMLCRLILAVELPLHRADVDNVAIFRG